MFGRVYELRVGRSYSELAETKEITEENQRQALNNFISQGEVFTNPVIEGLVDIDDVLQFQNEDRLFVNQNHIEFEVDKIGSDSTDGNQGEITIYNLSDQSSKILSRLAGSKSFIELRGGYRDEPLRTLFRGNIQTVEDKFDGVDRRTKIEVSDGGAFVQNQLSSRAYPKGTPIDDIVDDLLQDLALPRGVIYRLGPDVVTTKPTVLYGRSADQLKRILITFDYTVNIQDMFVNVISKKIDSVVNSAADFSNIVDTDQAKIPTVINVTASSGLISSPSFIGDFSDLSPGETKEQSSSGVKFRMLLTGEIIPNNIIQLVSKNIAGLFRVLKVTHRGSFEGDEWETEVEAEWVGLGEQAISVSSGISETTNDPQRNIDDWEIVAGGR